MPGERASVGFGSKLREARERRGVTLRQIANATKISVSALEALERNDISRLPGGIFTRAFVRSYAIEVGLEPEEMIQEFMAQFPHDSVTAGHPTSEHIDDHEGVESDRRMASTILRLLVMSIPIIAVVLYFTATGMRSDPPSTPAGEPSAAAEQETTPTEAPPERPAASAPLSTQGAPVPPATAAAPVPATAPPVPASAGDRLTVSLSATGPCWVSASVDGRLVIEREFRPAESQIVEVRRELVLTAGDGAALAVTLNGAAARPLGAAGQVVTIRVDPSNFRDYLAQ